MRRVRTGDAVQAAPCRRKKAALVLVPDELMTWRWWGAA